MDCRCKLIVTDRRGFSLVEALVSGIISSILAGIFITVFIMYDRELQENGAYLRMQMQFETVAEQIAMHARLASLVLLTTETFSPTFPVQSEETGVQTVFMYDPSGTIIGRYDLGNDTLKEWVNGEWAAFEAGGQHFYLPVKPPRSKWDVLTMLDPARPARSVK